MTFLPSNGIALLILLVHNGNGMALLGPLALNGLMALLGLLAHNGHNGMALLGLLAHNGMALLRLLVLAHNAMALLRHSVPQSQPPVSVLLSRGNPKGPRNLVTLKKL